MEGGEGRVSSNVTICYMGKTFNIFYVINLITTDGLITYHRIVAIKLHSITATIAVTCIPLQRHTFDRSGTHAIRRRRQSIRIARDLTVTLETSNSNPNFFPISFDQNGNGVNAISYSFVRVDHCL